MRFLNLGILAHVDAGKTTLTERLLFSTGVIAAMGSVDDGSTQTDFLALERQRGITIKAAAVSFAIGDVTVNLLDTPGHPDFIAEVERVLSVLDGAILVISAVEGVQPQTRVLMRALQRLHIPTLIVVNKIDRGGADLERVLHQIATRLNPAMIPMGSTVDLGMRSATAVPFGPQDAEFVTRLTERLSEHSDHLLAAYLDDPASVSYEQLWCELARQTRQALVHPVFFGSAMTGAGMDAVIAAITTLLPTSTGDANAPVSGSVFKIERGAAGEKIAYVRMFAGALHVRERVRFGDGHEGRVTALSVFDHGGAVRRDTIIAGQIGKLWGLNDIRIGDLIGSVPEHLEHYTFAPPTLETLIVPRRPAERRALYTALSQLEEQDPLINLRKDEVRQELFVSLYGEVQKEVIQATLAADYHLEVDFQETTTICVERLIGVGIGAEIMGAPDNPCPATIGLRIEPGPVKSGLVYRLAIEVHGKMPAAFFKAVEESVRETLRQGLYGWQVTDCVITLTQVGYDSVSSVAGHYRIMTPLAVMTALQQAGTLVHEPMQRFTLEVPAEALGKLLPLLIKLRAVTETPTLHGTGYVLEGIIPVAQMHELQQLLPGLTRGEGVLESVFERYEPVHGDPPTRARTDNNPLNRRVYLLQAMRR